MLWLAPPCGQLLVWHPRARARGAGCEVARGRGGGVGGSSVIACKLVENQFLPNDELSLIPGTECGTAVWPSGRPSSDPKLPLDVSHLLCKRRVNVLLSWDKLLRRMLSGSVVLDVGDSSSEQLLERVLLSCDELRRKLSGSVVLGVGS